MYLRIIFTVFQCSPPGFAMYQLTAPTVDAYGAEGISFLSGSLLRHILEDNLKLTGNGVEIGLQSCMLKCRRIFFK